MQCKTMKENVLILYDFLRTVKNAIFGRVNKYL